MRRATTYLDNKTTQQAISIHALLAESDSRAKTIPAEVSHFYPRSPCGERRYRSGVPVVGRSISIHALLAESDYDGLIASANFCRFLSTLSLRRATVTFELYNNLCQDFYPRSPCGERLCAFTSLFGVFLFLSTLSLRRATLLSSFIIIYAKISIHALLAESDVGDVWACRWPDISIHALLAESDKINIVNKIKDNRFLSTLSLRRATRLPEVLVRSMRISIHALLAESDFRRAARSRLKRHFYPRSPCGERRK